MKNLVLLFIFFGSLISLKAQTKVDSIISASTVWSKENSPYLIEKDVTILKGANLTISKGVSILLKKDVFLKVNGSITANGLGDSISFGPLNQMEPWGGIILSGEGSASVFKYCQIVKGGNKSKGLVQVFNHAANFDNCMFASSTSNAIYNYQGKVNINSSTLYNNNGWGINFEGDVKEEITINNNSFISNKGGAIKFSGEDLGVINFKNNSLIENQGEFTIFIPLVTGTGRFDIIENKFLNNNNSVSLINALIKSNIYFNGNIIENNKSNGILIKLVNISPNSTLIQGNTFTNNTSSSDHLCQWEVKGYYSTLAGNKFNNNNCRWSILSLNIDIQINSLFKYNCFTENKAYSNILITKAAMPLLGNTFANNSVVYDIENSIGAGSVIATDNFWNTSNEEEIRKRIKDYEDDPSLGSVKFIPLAQVSDNSECVKVITEIVANLETKEELKVILRSNELVIDLSSVRELLGGEIHIYDSQGLQISSRRTDSENSKLSFETFNFSPGLYLIVFENGSESKKTKFVIHK